jgi:HEAT repeat protein
VSALEDRDPDVRATAGTAVYRRLLTDSDTDARRATAAALGRIRDTAAVEPLVKTIMDADEGVRVAAIQALASIGEVSAVMPMIIVLAHEQVRQKSTGRSALAVERAASRALDTLCDASAIEQLQAALDHDDTEVREIAVRRLARIGTKEVAPSLAASLDDADPAIRRAAARGLAEVDWSPPANLNGARYWAALREWRRCAECGPDAIPLLVSSFDGVDALQRTDIVGALAELGWQPDEANATAAHFWAAQGKWDKVAEIGEPAVETLDAILTTAPKWRDRVAAAATLATLNQPRSAPFTRLDLVQRGLAIIDGEGSEKDKHGLFEALLADEKQIDAGAETVDWCKCGYPAAKVKKTGLREPIAGMLGFEQNAAKATTYYCPSCDTRRTTVAA